LISEKLSVRSFNFPSPGTSGPGTMYLS